MPIKKKILWFNFKDIKHPEAGGAEIVTHEIGKKLVQEGHEVTLISPMFQGSEQSEIVDGIKIIRVGKSKLGHYPAAIKYYLQNLKNKFDIIIEEVNTIPYFINFFTGKEQVFLYYNQLAREIWFYQMRQPLSLIGYIIEPIYTWIQSIFNNKVITISESSKQDLMRFGFQAKNIDLMTMFYQSKPLEKYAPESKEKTFTVLFNSSLRPMKRPIEVFKAFDILAKKHDKVQLWVSGGGDQTELKEFAKTNNFLDKVTFFGFTPEEKKLQLMQSASVLCSTSLKEGWGLIVTEANTMATPAIVYDVDGLRDSARAGDNWVVQPNPEALAAELENLYAIFNEDRVMYDQKCEEVLEKSYNNTIEQCYADFKGIVGLR